MSIIAFAPAMTLAQGTLTPPGPPGPTMKTLDQVEARTPIDSTHTPGDDGNLFIISKTGSYYLTGNVTGAAGKNGITVSASHVTIDLNGFEVVGVPNSLDGINIGVSSDVTICNGTVRSWGSNGIDGTGPGTRARDLRISSNVSFGMELGRNAEITRCTIDSNDTGVLGFNDCLVEHSQAFANHINGFDFPAGGALIRNCVATGNGNHGINAGSYSKVTACLANSNAGYGINLVKRTTVPTGASTVSHCTTQSNLLGGITVEGECTVVENHCDWNRGAGAGITVFGQHNRIESNEATQNTNRGIWVTGDFNIIIKNTVAPALGGTAYEIAAGNKVGPIIDAPGSGAISGRSGGTGIGTTDPWANFTY